jgi:hypothetical protein
VMVCVISWIVPVSWESMHEFTRRRTKEKTSPDIGRQSRKSLVMTLRFWADMDGARIFQFIENHFPRFPSGSLVVEL